MQLFYKNRLLLTALLLVCALGLRAEWMPFIVNYGKADYGTGATTWRIASAGSWTFFSNQRGLLAFDGVSWTRYELHNRSEARGVAVFPDAQRVFVGGEDEYGYFDVGPTGALDYHCLSEQVDSQYAHIGNIFEIYELNGSYYLRGDNNILVMAGDKLSLIRSADKIFCSLLHDGIYVATDHGVKMLVGRRLVPIAGGELLDGKRINTMFTFGEGMMVTTATDGLYYYDGQGVSPYATPADDLLRRGVVCCAAYRDGTIAFGTIHNGLVIYDTRTGTVKNYDEMQGLQSNTVISVAFDAEGNVWAGLDYGIDHVLLQEPLTYLYRAPFSYGIGYTALLKDQRLYLGTDRGLYYTAYPVAFPGRQPDLHPVEGVPSGLAWCLYQHGDELFCLHDRGIFSIHGDRATRITDVQGAWACAPVEGRPDDLFVGTYGGVSLISRRDGYWRSLGQVEGIAEPCRHFRQTGPRTLKVYNTALGTATEYTLDARLLRVTARRSLREALPAQPQQGAASIATGSTLTVGDKDIIPYDKGFVMLNHQKEGPAAGRLAIRRMYLTTPRDSLVYSSNFCDLAAEPRLGYAHNSVRFEFQMPHGPLSAAPRYRYRLNGGQWSEPTENATKEYSGLYEGSYTFEVSAVGADGRQQTASVSFRILPPWYRSWGAYLLYALAAVVAAWRLVVLERRRVARHEQEAVREKSLEVDQMKIEISQLEKDKMELDIRHKSQEIANLMVSVARKNEVLTALKGDIRAVALRLDRNTAADCKRQLLLINNRIDSNMEGDEVLKRFEEQFDLVNDNFMKRLRELHPELSQNERLMCAYLKMDLSTKEIAPLLSISVRGVETMRYRLRKKFSLDRESSLTDYLSHLS